MAAKKEKVIKIETTRGNVWTLGRFGMVSSLINSSHLQRFVSRSEVKRCLNVTTRTDSFHGDQFWTKNRATTKFQAATWEFDFIGGQAQFGCQSFSPSATKKLAKWAGVTNL